MRYLRARGNFRPLTSAYKIKEFMNQMIPLYLVLIGIEITFSHILKTYVTNKKDLFMNKKSHMKDALRLKIQKVF